VSNFEAGGDIRLFRQVVNLVLYAIKHDKLEVLFEIALQAIKGGFDYRTAMMRLDGSYYEQQVKLAADRYRAEHPDEFVANVSGVPGLERWQKEQAEQKARPIS
jgi:hypothetical protein